MNPDDKLDAMSSLAALATTTETGKRLFHALVTDGLVTRVMRDTLDDSAEMKAMTKSMTSTAIIELAVREMGELDPDERDSLLGDVMDEFQNKLVAATRHAWTVATCLGYPASHLDPEVVAFVAAVYTIPVDATHADDDDPDRPTDRPAGS